MWISVTLIKCANILDRARPSQKMSKHRHSHMASAQNIVKSNSPGALILRVNSHDAKFHLCLIMTMWQAFLNGMVCQILGFHKLVMLSSED